MFSIGPLVSVQHVVIEQNTGIKPTFPYWWLNDISEIFTVISNKSVDVLNISILKCNFMNDIFDYHDKVTGLEA